MRILIASNYQPPHMGGIEYAAEALKRCWEEKGHEVTWITTDIPHNARPSTADNVRVPAANFAERWWQINTPLVSPLAYPSIRRHVASHDAINTHSLAPGLATLVLQTAIRQGKPTVATQHVGVIPLSARLLSVVQERFICRVAQWIVRRDARLTFVGKAVRDWFIQHAAISPDQVTMTPAGIDQSKYYFVTDDERKACQEKWDVSPERLNVLFVGRFYEKKGMPLIREVARRCPEVQFTFRGNGPDDPRSWGLHNTRVIPLVSQQELRELYGSHDLFIMPSIGEGWPAVVPQAMACGLACLISEETFQGFNKDAERFLVCARDADVVTQQIQNAAGDKLPLIRQRRELSDYAAREWDWMATAEIYLGLFEELRSRA